MDKFLAVLFKWLFPPGPDASPQDHHTWRIGIAGALFIVMFTVAAQLMWSLGLQPFADTGGVLTLADAKVYIAAAGAETTKKIDDLTKEVRTTRVQELTSKILTTQSQRCLADQDPAQARLAALLDEQLVALQDEYQRKNGISFPLPPCSARRSHDDE